VGGTIRYLKNAKALIQSRWYGKSSRNWTFQILELL